MKQPEHPRFNGDPILIGDVITFDNVPSTSRPVEAVVSTIRVVNGEVWIHVFEPDGKTEGNEVIFSHPHDGGRSVIGHTKRVEA